MEVSRPDSNCEWSDVKYQSDGSTTTPVIIYYNFSQNIVRPETSRTYYVDEGGLTLIEKRKQKKCYSRHLKMKCCLYTQQTAMHTQSKQISEIICTLTSMRWAI